MFTVRACESPDSIFFMNKQILPKLNNFAERIGFHELQSSDR
jgi:hypothetical protein